MASSKSKGKSSQSNNSENRVVYSEFGNGNSAALERGIQELPPNQQNLRVQASRKGRKGKTVTVISGFQAKPETLTKLLKQLKKLNKTYDYQALNHRKNSTRSWT